MRCIHTIAIHCVHVVLIPAILAGICFADNAAAQSQHLSELLQRTSRQTAEFLDQFSDVKCTEQVRQEKLGTDDKV